jgi:hypothetical protein
VDTSKTQYATGTKCVTESMVTGLASSSTSTAVGRATHTKVDVSPLKISQASISIGRVSAAGLKNTATSHTLISFTTPNNVAGNTTCSFSETVSYTLKLVAGAFTQSTTGTTITSTSVVGTLYYPGGTLDINVPVSQYGTSQASLNIPSFNVASLFPNTEYTVTISLRTAANVGANTVKATLTPSISLATMNYYCHNKLVKYTKLLNDCKAEVPFSVKISNAKNVSTKFDTIKLSLRYTLSASATSSTISLVTKEWNEIPKNDYKSSVLMVPIRNTSIPINTYQSVLVFWAGEAGAKQDIRIGYEYGTSTIEYESYTSCKTKTNERQTYQTPNGLAYLLQDLTGVVYNVK